MWDLSAPGFQSGRKPFELGETTTVKIEKEFVTYEGLMLGPGDKKWEQTLLLKPTCFLFEVFLQNVPKNVKKPTENYQVMSQVIFSDNYY